MVLYQNFNRIYARLSSLLLSRMSRSCNILWKHRHTMCVCLHIRNTKRKLRSNKLSIFSYKITARLYLFRFSLTH